MEDDVFSTAISWVINSNNNNTSINYTTTEYFPALEEISIQNDIDKPSSALYEFLVVGIGITICSIVGTIGNIISFCVLSRASMRSTISHFLLGLTLSDTLLILSSLLLFGIPVILQYFLLESNNGYMVDFYIVYGPIVYAIALTAQTSSVYFTIAVTVERYLVVCWPLQSRSMCTIKRTKLVSIGIFLFGILYNLPRWWELEGKTKTVYPPSGNSSSALNESAEFEYQLDFTEFRSDPYYIDYYINWAYLLIMCLFPFVILVTLNVLIYKEIRRSNKHRNGIIASHTRDYSFAPVLFVVVITFLICNTPALVINLMEALWNFFIIDLEIISNFLITFNCSVNCAIYCAFGHKFREELFQLRHEVKMSFRCLLARGFSRKFSTSLKVQLPT